VLYQQYWYLPFLFGTLLVYWLLCRTVNQKKYFLLVASVALLLSIQVEFTLALLCWTTAVFFLSRRLANPDVSRRGTLLVLGIVAVLAYLAFFKYLPPLLVTVFGTTNSGYNMDWLHRGLILPLGLSYFTFKFLHYMINAYRGQLVKHEPVDFFLYTVFFPIVPAGPIERIEGFVERARFSWDSEGFVYGLQRITLGVTKKLLLVDSILIHYVSGQVAWQLMQPGYNGIDLIAVWTFLIASFLYAYLDFSAYTDIAVGTARLFGYTICENFRYPIFQKNLAEFWQRWHMSLSSWCRDYVYMPVLGHSRNPKLALYASMMTIGAWHQLSFNWLTWGALHATGLVCLMKWHQLRRKWKIPVRPEATIIGHVVGSVVTFLFVCWVFAFVSVPSPVAALQTFLFAVTGRVWL
jgi:alginate O-acetyltransferase complex protein AlgI